MQIMYDNLAKKLLLALLQILRAFNKMESASPDFMGLEIIKENGGTLMNDEIDSFWAVALLIKKS